MMYGATVAPDGTASKVDEWTASLTIQDNHNAVMESDGYTTEMPITLHLDDNEQWIIWKVDDINHYVPLSMIDFSRPTEDIILPGYAAEYHGTKYYL